MDFQQWINQLMNDNIYLHHKTLARNIPSILKNGFNANYVNLERVIDPDIISETNHLPAVYFQLVKGIFPNKIYLRIEDVLIDQYDDNIQISPYDLEDEDENDSESYVEFWLSPSILENKQIVFHPNSWSGGSNLNFDQWSTMKNLSNISLAKAHDLTIYKSRYTSLRNEVMIIGDISRQEFNQHLIN